MALLPTAGKNMFQKEALLAEMAEMAQTLYLKLMKVSIR